METDAFHPGLAEDTLLESAQNLYRLFVSGESRFLYACLSKGFDPSIGIVAESSFTIMAVYKALKRRSDFRGYANTSSEALALFSRSKPGIACIVESGSQCLYGDVIEFVSASCPCTRSILFLSSLQALDHSPASRADAIVAEKDVFLPINPVYQGLMALIAGTVYRSPSVVRYLEESPVALDSPSPDRLVLGLRDQQLLEAYVLGLSNREVAEKLSLSVRTVQTYSGQLLQRLGVNNRQKAILRAIELGISFVPKYFRGTSN